MSPFQPTPEQRAILAYQPGQDARVLAGPGTGKSATLVALIDQLLRGDEPLRVKLLTFTRAATGELAKKVSAHPAAAAERPSKIHSFAISVLLRNPGVGEFPQPLRIADDWEKDQIVYATLARRIGVQKKRLDDLFRELAANWESLKEEEHPRVRPEDRARFLGGWQEHREIFGYTLLSELPYALRMALLDHSDLKGVTYDLLIVDEYQDLNACDLEVLRLIGERGYSIIAAGDDDQSIYSFRRAAPEGIRRFPGDYPGCADYSLSVTHRCGSRIIEWASFVIEGDPDRPAKRRLVPAEGSPPGVVALLSFSGATSEARGVAKLVQRLVHQEGIAPADILILLRSDHQGTFSKPIKEALAELDIPYSDPDVVKRVLAEPANRHLLATLRLLRHRTDSLAWATLLTFRPESERASSTRSTSAHGPAGNSSGRRCWKRTSTDSQRVPRAQAIAVDRWYPRLLPGSRNTSRRRRRRTAGALGSLALPAATRPLRRPMSCARSSLLSTNSSRPGRDWDAT